MQSSVQLLIMMAFVLPLLQAQEVRTTASPHGTVVWLNLRTSLFPHPARAEGHVYRDRVYPFSDHYSDSTVAVFIPEGFAGTDEVDLIVHFHGWFSNLDSVLSRFDLPGQLKGSGKRALLVVPQGPKNAPDSFGGKLEEEEGFRKFIEELLEVLAPRFGVPCLAARSVILSGHSGAYRVISFILERGGMTPLISEVYLFDALYGRTEQYRQWVESSSGKLRLITTEDGGTRAETENFKGELAAWGTPFLSSNDRDVGTEDLRRHRIVFLTTDLGHNEVISERRTFELFLRASSLDDIRKP